MQIALASFVIESWQAVVENCYIGVSLSEKFPRIHPGYNTSLSQYTHYLISPRLLSNKKKPTLPGYTQLVALIKTKSVMSFLGL